MSFFLKGSLLSWWLTTSWGGDNWGCDSPDLQVCSASISYTQGFDTFFFLISLSSNLASLHLWTSGEFL